ncbi:MAG: peroxidase-related enzyme [Alphaproteobacteria bacterium]|nr:peroxidase-related enzyme [Alphaproteobacteria bacterium]
MKDKEENNYIWDLDIEPKLDILDEEMTRYIEVCKEKLGMVPNVILANASDKERLKNFVNFYNRLMMKDGFLTKLEREMIAVVVSSCNKCFYCLIAHGAAVRQLSNDQVLGDELMINYRSASLSERQRLILDFSYKLTETPSKVENSDRNILRKANFSDEEILEIVEVASFFNMSNRIAVGTDMRPNAEYHNMARK